MQNKLQELTNKLYNEGLSKGKQEAEQMKATAKQEADAIIAQAKEKAKEILENAQNSAEELKTKAENDIKMASSQAFTSLKQEIEKAIITKSVSTPIDASLTDKAFIESIISQIVKAFNPSTSEPVALSIILPEAIKADADKYVTAKVQKLCTAGLDVTFSKNLDSGFKIGPKAEGYMLSFTNEDFKALIGEFLRPKTRTLLFGE